MLNAYENHSFTALRCQAPKMAGQVRGGRCYWIADIYYLGCLESHCSGPVGKLYYNNGFETQGHSSDLPSTLDGPCVE